MTTLEEIEAAIRQAAAAPTIPAWEGAPPFVILRRDPHHVQLKLPRDEPPWLEVIANRFLEDEAQLMPGVEAGLLADGWNLPNELATDRSILLNRRPEERCRNYWRRLAPDLSPLELAYVTAATATSVFRTPLRRFALLFRPTSAEVVVHRARAAPRRSGLP